MDSMFTFDGYKNPIILWAIPSDEFLHPCVTDVSVVFIKNFYTKETRCFSFNNSDLSSVCDKKTFVDELNKMDISNWVFDKKLFIQLLPNTKNLLDINLYHHFDSAKIINKEDFQTQAHKFIYRTKRNCGDLNKTIPLVKHKEMFEKMCDVFFKEVHTNFLDSYTGYITTNELFVETLAELESNGIYVNSNFSNYFNVKIPSNNLVHSQYNLYTNTGRPSNHFDGINYAALNKEDGVRNCFVSRHGNDGMMILMDYSAFHPRIICNLVNFPISIDQDLYKYLGEMYFHREPTEYDMEEIKRITMRQLYGGVEEKYESINYFGGLKTFMNDYWEKFQKNGYIFTPIYHRLITSDHMKDANPNKLFNYILQSTESEIALTSTNLMNKYLRCKKTKAVLYTYDSLLFDFNKEDGIDTIKELMKIMKMSNRFPIKVYAGNSYGSLHQIA